MDSALKVVVTLAVEIQALIKANEQLADKADTLVIFIGSLQTALAPLQAFESLPHATQISIQGNITALITTMETLKREVQRVIKTGFTLNPKGKIETLDKLETDMRNTLKSLQVNWDLMSTLNQETKFNATRLLSHATAKRFWTTHFGAEHKYADWTDFKHTLHEAYGVADADELKILEAALCKDGKVSVYSFNTITQAEGIPASFWKLVHTDNPEKANIMIQEEVKQVEAMYNKLIAIVESSTSKIGRSASMFIEGIPKAVDAEITKEYPDYGVKRILSLGSVSAKKIKKMATKTSESEITTYLKTYEDDVQACITQLTTTVQFAHADGFCQRLLSQEIMEARINKITTHLTQKGFVNQFVDNAKVDATKKITDKINKIETLTISDSSTNAAFPLQSLSQKHEKEEFSNQVQTKTKEGLQEALKLMFLQPITRMLKSKAHATTNITLSDSQN